MLNRRVADQVGAGRFVSFSREEWAGLRAATPLTVSEAEVEQVARSIWREINLVNLKENIEPTRERAHLILDKDGQHLVQSVRLRKL